MPVQRTPPDSPHSGPEAPAETSAGSFDPVWYLETNPDVAASGIDPALHWETLGRNEGRIGVPLRAPGLDHDLWRSANPGTEAALLHTLMQDGPPHERALAGWALARWYVDRGDTIAARAAIGVFHDHAAAGRRHLPHAGPWLLGVQLYLATGEIAAARALRDRAVAIFGPTPDLALAEMLVIKAEGAATAGDAPAGGIGTDKTTADGTAVGGAAVGEPTPDGTTAKDATSDTDAALSMALAGAYLPHGLVPVFLEEGPGARFDRLAAPATPPEPDRADPPAPDTADLPVPDKILQPPVPDMVQPPVPGETPPPVPDETPPPVPDETPPPVPDETPPPVPDETPPPVPGETPPPVPGETPPPVPGETTLPLVTVIMPVFDAEAVLARALAGLVAQNWSALEILVVDDGSTDDSREIAAAAAARDPRIRLLPQPRNAGAYAARNAGMAAARGRFITIHDADDWSHPAKIRSQVLPLIAEPALAATVSHWVRTGPDLEMTRFRMEEGWVYRNVSSLMIRADLRDILGYWDRARVNADTEYYYRIIAAFGAHAIREVGAGLPLAFGRTLPTSLTMRGETHLRSQFGGLRKEYMEAAHAWHARATRAAIGPVNLYVPQIPAQRPFRAPAALTLGDPDPAPSDYDILRGSDLMDADWYLTAYPDVGRADMDPARHYLQRGAFEGRDPGPFFSTTGYAHAHGLTPGDVPLLHWEREGRAAGSDSCPSFPGALTVAAAEGAPVALVFAHHAGTMLFGAERSFLDMLDRLAATGRVPVVVLPGVHNPDYLDAVARRAVRVEVLPQLWRLGRRTPPARSVEAARALIRRHGAAEVHVNTLVLDAPLFAARAEGVPCTVHVRELPDQDTTLCRNLDIAPDVLRRDLLAQADRFVANSPLVAGWLGVPERTEIRPNSVDPALFALPFEPDEDRPDRPLRVGLISSNVLKKGVSDFLIVARLALEAGSTARFLLIGPPSRELHLLRPFPANVDYAGYAASPCDAMRQVDLVLSLSKFAESFGRTVLEAMAAGRPVVCYDRGHPSSLVETGVSGLVVASDDTGAAARATLALDTARIALAGMSAAARDRARVLTGAAGADPAPGSGKDAGRPDGQSGAGPD